MEKPDLHLIQGKEMKLSGSALLELMQGVLAKGVPFRFRAKGWSMTPFIRDGDIILIIPNPNSQHRLGDIVAFIHPESGKPLVHRIVRKNRLACLMQGDNNSGINDGWIPKDKIVGLVYQAERNGKKVRLGLSGPERYGIALFSRMGILALFSSLYGKIKKLRRKNK